MSGDLQSEEPENFVSIEMLYQQRMTVRIPTDEPPATPEGAFHLVKNTDPEFVGDVIPSRWEQLCSTGNLEVVDITEGEYADE